jgi:two-component system NtrC family response regulator
VVSSAAALAEQAAITPSDLAFARSGDPGSVTTDTIATMADAVAALERRMIGTALAATANNHSAAARRLGLSRVGLLKMMTRLGLR